MDAEFIVEEIAKAAGVSEALVFKHCPTKRALYAAILAAKVTVDELLGAVEESAAYLACAERKEGDDPDALGLESLVLPGGRYLRERLHGEPPGVYDQIAPAFQTLAEQAEVDETRPSIEFYRRRDEIDLLLPVT